MWEEQWNLPLLIQSGSTYQGPIIARHGGPWILPSDTREHYPVITWGGSEVAFPLLGDGAMAFSPRDPVMAWYRAVPGRAAWHDPGVIRRELPGSL